MAEAAARRLVSKRFRRWHKAKKTYISSGKYSYFDGPSVAKRVQQRLFTADCNLAEARGHVAMCRVQFVRLRTFLKLYERLRVEPYPNPDTVLMGFWERAKRRLLEPIPVLDTRDMWPAQRRNIWIEWNEERAMDLL